MQTGKGEFTIPGRAYLDKRDLEARPPLTVMNVNVWDTVSRNRPNCRVAHGTAADWLDATFVKDENRYYFHINASGCDGWVPETFLSSDRHAPFGDQQR